MAERLAVIMPAWNAADYIESSVRSVLEQTHRELRLIVVDDGSTDRTPEILARLAAEDERLTVMTVPNGGPAKARNRALGLSVRDMTFEVRRYFKFDDKAPGIVIARVKPGSPAAVAGLKPFELVTEVNGEKVTGAKDFAAKIKGRADLVFAVRRLAQTRMVKIHVEQE